VADLRTARLILHLVDAAEGERIVARAPGDADFWVSDFPFDGDVVGASAFLHAMAEHGEQGPFGFYRISRVADERAIGGIGFKGQPRGGRVEVGYGLAPSARGHGYAAEALKAILNVAAEHGVSHVVAQTDENNVASQRTLERAGLRRVGTERDVCLYEIALT